MANPTRRSKRSLISAWALASVLVLGLASPSMATNRQSDEDLDGVDARLLGYRDTNTALLPSSSSGTTWMLLIVLGAIGSVGLFKDAKRSHLD